MKILKTSVALDERARVAAKTAADALIAALAPRSTPPELWTAIIIDAIPLFEGAFDAAELFSPASCRLLSARARFAADLSRASSSADLDAASARAPKRVTKIDLAVAACALAVARLTNRVAFEA
jgi:nuclear pore complex protein Nup85